jgi:hypothetical protein
MDARDVNNYISAIEVKRLQTAEPVRVRKKHYMLAQHMEYSNLNKIH